MPVDVKLAAHAGAPALARWRAALPLIVLAVLAGHFALVQLLTGVQFGDGPRNLHWGLLTWEQPAFLSGAADPYDRVRGFPPEPPELGPRRLWAYERSGLHPWWGPVTPLLLAATWGLTRSYTLLQLITPVAAGAAVLLTYGAGRRLLGPGPALVAAAFLSCFPVFREYGTVSYNEAQGALLLSAALFSYLGGRTVPAVLFGALAALTKMDLLALGAGTVGVTMLYDRCLGRRELLWRHHLLSLAAPVLLAAPWVWLHYLGGGQRGPTAALNSELLLVIAPMMLELTFYLPWQAVALALGVIAAIVALGLQARALPPLATVLLEAWLGLGLLVVLVYCATPGAGNSPRIFIPALPALALLFAAGFSRLGAAWRLRAGLALLALFLAVNAGVIWYHEQMYGRPLRAAAPAFADLRERPRGHVLTPYYWETLLYTRQPVAWFEGDPSFEAAVMGDPALLDRYLEANPIAYALLPDAYFDANPERPTAPAVRAYLAARADPVERGPFTLWTLRER